MTDKNSILAKLKTAIPLDIRILEAAGSTNSVAKDAARSGAAENTVIIAERQTAGRGRGSHTFFSPESTGIYMSILLRPHFEYALCPLITTAAAAATARAIEELSGKKALIKWINDIFVGSGKVCGILTEASADTSKPSPDYAVVGIGVNLSPPEGGFPDEIAHTAATVFDSAQQGNGCREALIAEILNNFFAYYTSLEKREFFEEYKKRLFVLGREIFVVRAEQLIPARALDIDENCRLEVQYSDGSREHLDSGEISIRADSLGIKTNR